MQDLDSQIRAAIRRLGITNGTVVDSLSNLVPILSVLLTLVITVATVLTGLDDSSGDADGDTPQPVVNEQMRTDLLRAIEYHRDIPVDF
ncbi:MAG: CAP domain-containing protein, partial [Corynebacterium sp.]|nr:CAP domain-containing protein [Corynebacterium sp.]